MKRSVRRQKMYVLRCIIDIVPYNIYGCMHAVLTWLTDPWLTPKLESARQVMPPKPSDTASCDQTKSWQWNISFAVTTFLYRWLAHTTGSGKSLCHFLWQRIESTQSIVVVVSPRSCPQISEAYVVSRGKSGRDDALKGCLRLPVLRSEAAQRMQNTETDAITTYFIPNLCHRVF